MDALKDDEPPMLGAPLGKPVRSFADTFSAFTVLRETFFPAPPEARSAGVDPCPRWALLTW
jgi:hypothetical protein